ncbi:hypothetical protein BH11PLA2_BH11PLA2_14340 [soil metagenome]
MLFLLIAGHALGDFALQGDAMASCKCKNTTNPLQKSVPWFHWLAAHALIHGLIVSAIVSWWGYSKDAAVVLGIAETAIHFGIDWLKCQGYTNIHLDQLLHILCKVAWWALLMNNVIA